MTWWCGMSAAQMLPVAINHAVDVSIKLSGPLSPDRRCRAGAAGQPTGAGTIFDGMLAPRVFAGRCMMTWMDEGMQFFGLDQSADRCNHVGYWACAAEASQIAELDEAQATSQSRKPRGSKKARGGGMRTRDAPACGHTSGSSVASQLLGTAASAYHTSSVPNSSKAHPADLFRRS